MKQIPLPVRDLHVPQRGAVLGRLQQHRAGVQAARGVRLQPL
jgi:hypothetical protein